jgi:hypothetical protein
LIKLLNKTPCHSEMNRQEPWNSITTDIVNVALVSRRAFVSRLGLKPHYRTPRIDAESIDLSLLPQRRSVKDRRGCITLFGEQRHIEGIPDWHRDVISGYNWPDQQADIRVVWELSRLQWLPPIAESTRRDYARSILLDWIRRNPIGTGVNWISPMEAGLRGMSMLYSYRALHDHLSHEERNQIISSIYEHGDFVYNNPEWGRINANHFIADCTSLVVIGSVLWHRKECRRWRDHAWASLCLEMEKQVDDEGVHFENSTNYHFFVMELLGLAARTASLQGMPIPEEFADKLRKMNEFSALCMKPDGESALLGDSDTAAVDSHEPPPKRAARHFRHSGFAIIRNESDFMITRAGRHGTRGLGTHEHSDLLSLELNDLIVDKGTLTYRRDMDDCRTIGNHNCLIIDGQEQHEFTGNFSSRRTAKVISSGLTESGGKSSFRATIEYRNLIRHTREICLDVNRKEWSVYDTIEDAKDGKHDLKISFLMHPKVRLRGKGRKIMAETPHSRYAMDFSVPMEVKNSYHYPSYGRRLSTRLLSYDMRATDLKHINCRFRRV